MLGISVSKIGENVEEALGYLKKAYQIRRDISQRQGTGESEEMAEVLYNIGIIYEENKKQFKNAEDNYL